MRVDQDFLESVFWNDALGAWSRDGCDFINQADGNIECVADTSSLFVTGTSARKPAGESCKISDTLLSVFRERFVPISVDEVSSCSATWLSADCVDDIEQDVEEPCELCPELSEKVLDTSMAPD